MKPEIFFLRFAFPCSYIILGRGEISENEYNKLKYSAYHDKALPRDFLEKVYFRAFRRISRIAGEMKRSRWNKEVIAEYFRKRHNRAVSYSDNPESFKDLCRVYKARVLSAEKDSLFVRYHGNKTRRVKNAFIPHAAKGDRIRIHYHYAVEGY